MSRGMRSVCELGARDFRPCLDFFLITPHSIFVTHHSSLKIPNFSIPTHLAHFTHLLITQFYYFFVRPIPIKWSNPSVNKISFNQKTKTVTTTTTIVTHPSLPKHKPEPIKISEAPSPRQDRHRWTTPISLTCTTAWWGGFFFFFLNQLVFFVWMHLSVGLYLCASVLEKRSWEVKKKKKKPMKRNGKKKKCNQTQKPNVKRKEKKKKKKRKMKKTILAAWKGKEKWKKKKNVWKEK